jgi:hypothetical protein
MRIFILYIRTDPTDVPAFQKNVAKIMAITYFEVESRSEAVAGWQRDFFKLNKNNKIFYGGSAYESTLIKKVPRSIICTLQLT